MHSSPCFTANECLPHAPKSLSSTVAESTYIHGANRYMQRSSPTGNKCKAAPIKNNIISSKLEISNYHMSSESDAAIESESQDEDEKEEFEEGGWEDEGDKEDSVPSSPKDGGMFRRIESMSNLASRRSLLTTAFRDGDRAKALQDKAPCSKSAIRRSRTTTPNGPSTGNSRMRKGLVTRQATRSIPITKTISNNMHPPVMSPRTTRRLMLQRELTSRYFTSLYLYHCNNANPTVYVRAFYGNANKRMPLPML
jgi:hypothetical protein